MTTTAFFTRFDRHAQGKGLKGATTHYCPGCGHGLVHKYLAETITALGIQERTIAVSPVGCAVFLYYYLDVGNTQAAHGRAPAVAIAHKLANPESIVISYQGDGDLAAIGLAEIIHAAQLGLPITVVFVNNAIYGMTGGQMAPTTLTGQTSATTPRGRGVMEGLPLRVAELIAGIDGSAYVERVALFDLKTRKRARKAIEHALEMQVGGRGFAFVEVLSECPTHLGLTGTEAEAWVRDHMVPVFPLGKLKDEAREPWNPSIEPSFDVERVLEILGSQGGGHVRHGSRFPEHLDAEDVALKLAGAGGDGAQTAAMLITKAAITEGFDATHIPSYGPESRGGTSYADVHIARREVLSPAAPNPHVLVAFNAPSMEKFAPSVRPGGVIVYDSDVVSALPELTNDVTLVAAPLTQAAQQIGSRLVKNVIALGVLLGATNILARDALLDTMRRALKKDCVLLELDEAAFARGLELAVPANAGSVGGRDT